MKSSRTEKVAIALAILATVALTGCGSSGSSSALGVPVGAYGTGVGVAGSQTVGFAGTATVNSSNIIAQYGQLSVSGAVTGGQWNGSGPDAAISMNIVSSSAYPTYGIGVAAPSATTIQGELQFTAYTMQVLESTFGSFTVTGIAMSLGIYNEFTLYAGDVYIFVNGATTPIPLQF